MTRTFKKFLVEMLKSGLIKMVKINNQIRFKYNDTILSKEDIEFLMLAYKKTGLKKDRLRQKQDNPITSFHSLTKQK
jgi:hypothetical protein|tara:strand:- start:4479 stop:4709 length:231 start_codon:yes stop_codon:yes gene_type:complete